MTAEAAAYLLTLWLTLVVGVGAVGFVTMGYDKWAATRRPRRRIPEATLLLLGVPGGACLMCLAMWLFRHKTKHRKFALGLPLLALCQMAAAVGLWLIKENAL